MLLWESMIAPVAMLAASEAMLAAFVPPHTPRLASRTCQGPLMTMSYMEQAQKMIDEARAAPHDGLDTSSYLVQVQALQATAARGRDQPPTSAHATAEDSSAQLAALESKVSELEAQLEARALQAERELQATGAFWIEQLNELKLVQSTAMAEQVPTAGSADATVAALEAQLAAMALRAEQELQATSAFWIERLSEQRQKEAESRAGDVASAAEPDDDEPWDVRLKRAFGLS